MDATVSKSRKKEGSCGNYRRGEQRDSTICRPASERVPTPETFVWKGGDGLGRLMGGEERNWRRCESKKREKKIM